MLRGFSLYTTFKNKRSRNKRKGEMKDKKQ